MSHMINPIRTSRNHSRKAIQGLAVALFAGSVLFGLEAQAASLAKNFTPRGAQTLDHSAFGALLSQFVIPGTDGINRVNYRGLKAARSKLQAYLTRMQAVSVPSLSSKAAKAYWINLYNAKTLDVVVTHYPMKSIRDINLGGGFLTKGPWKKKLLKVGGVDLSLDDVEHSIARATWKDPRLHYGFNCASIGCPNLDTSAYSAKTIDAQLDDAARAFINHPRGVAASKDGLTVSKLFKWYKADFGNDNQRHAHWQKYATGSLKTNLSSNKTVKAYRYDWSLNEAR